MAFVVHRSADYRRMRWKNGLGETAEVAIEPEGAPLDAFDWRISMARVGADGPFSPFAGIDRTLTLLEGTGLRLLQEGRAPVLLGPLSEPHAFPGDVGCSATLVDGAITDLNVMTRRTRCWHRVTRLASGAGSAVADAGVTFLVATATAPARLAIDGTEVTLSPLDAVSLTVGRGRVEVRDAGPGGVLRVEIGWVGP